MARVLIHVQHLLGTGHLVRAALLARALARAGHAVDLVSGGRDAAMPDIGGARLHRLPALAAGDASFARLVDAAGRDIDDAWRARRAALLMAVFDAARPDMVITETFPFGRRALRYELLPLLDAARRRGALVVASIRDVLHAARKPERIEEAADLFDAAYHAVLVHGDPALVPLEASFAATRRIADRIRYTGYMADDEQAVAAGDGGGEVVVSAGGGAVGAALMTAALGARALGALDDRPWRLLVGGNLDPAVRRDLAAAAPAGVVVEAARPDFPDLLAAASVSISQAGYNTAIDLFRARARAVLVPFAGAGETEQPTRARLMAEKGWAEIVAEEALDADALAAAVRRAAARPRPETGAIDLGGMAKSAAAVDALLAGRS